MRMTKKELEKFLSDVEIVDPEEIKVKWNITEAWLHSQDCAGIKVECPNCGHFILANAGLQKRLEEGRCRGYDYCGSCGEKMIIRPHGRTNYWETAWIVKGMIHDEK